MNTTLVCDDCARPYDFPPYYTFDPETCALEGYTQTAEGEKVTYSVPHPPNVCTGTLCPSCSGPDLEPDLASDPRRPSRQPTREQVQDSIQEHGETCRFCNAGLKCWRMRALEMRRRMS